MLFFNRFDKKTEISQQECFQLLTRATQVFREEYLQKQEHAQQEIQKRYEAERGKYLRCSNNFILLPRE